MQGRLLAAVLAVGVLAGCAARGPLLPSSVGADAPTRVELASTPFFPQERYQCGPAALATVLVASGVEVGPVELVDRVYLPGRQGSLQPEILAASRGYDRIAYRLDGDLEALIAELAAGRPVLVLQNLGLELMPRWHYAVAIGYDAGTDQLVLRSGTTERLVVAAHRFMKTWEGSERWAVVLVAPGQFPQEPARERYLEAAAGLEAAGRYSAALVSYDAAIARWPTATTALLGVGNVHYRQGALAQAAISYRRLLEIDPGHAVARNNLAQVLLEQGDPEAALREIMAARAQLSDERFEQLLSHTEIDIRKALAARK
jgi:tetratricopeptide (TPR) repeat protein